MIFVQTVNTEKSIRVLNQNKGMNFQICQEICLELG